MNQGLAYVDFNDEESLAAAVARNKEELMGRQVSIARSNPTKGRADTRGHGSVHGRGGAPSRGMLGPRISMKCAVLSY